MTQLAGNARLARWLALVTPAVLLAGAYIGEYGFHLYPCEMCWWQRYAHFAALAVAVLAFVWRRQRWPIGLAALAILASALIGGYHAGVEYKWWEGFTSCTSGIAFKPGSSALEAIMDAPRVRCDEVQWSLLGISLAGFNFLISGIAAASIFILLAVKPRGAVE